MVVDKVNKKPNQLGWMMKKCCEKYQKLTLQFKNQISWTEYQTSARKTPKGKKEEMNQKNPQKQSLYSQAFESIEEFVQVNIIDMKEVLCVKNIRTLYQFLIREMDGDEFKDASPYSQNIENKMLKRFGD